MNSAANKTSDLYRFVHASLACNPTLTYGTEFIKSKVGSQQGDPLSSLEYYDAVQPTLLETNLWTKLGYVDDINFEGKIATVAEDVQIIIDSFRTTGLVLNTSKCEIICSNGDLVDQYPIFKYFKRVAKENFNILSAPVFEGKAVDSALIAKITDLERSIECLSLLQSHDALCLSKNALTIIKVAIYP